MKLPGSGGSKEPYNPTRNVEVREHLVNERTLLAWVRTGVGLISIGFVIERAGALTAGNLVGREAAQTSELFGLALVVLGCLTLIVGAVQFFRNRWMIMAGVFDAMSATYMIVVAGSLLLAGAFIVYTLL